MKEPFESVVTRHGAAVLRVCRAVIGRSGAADAAQADDAWSETFLAALRAYPDLPDGANVQAWLVTIAQRKAIDQVRASGRRPVPRETVPDAPDARTAVGGWQRDLWDDVATLPEKQRAAVVYHHIAGWPHAEVAALLGGSPAAARRAAADGIAALRRLQNQEIS